MSPIPTSQHTDTNEPGSLLQELERRQDEVIAQLDDLDLKLRNVLKGLGVADDQFADDDVVAED